MKKSKIFKSILSTFALITVFSLSLATMFNVRAELSQNIAPNTLDPMTEIGESVLSNGNFTNVNAVNRQYGLGWRLSNLIAEYGAESPRSQNPATVSQETVTEKPDEMGNISTAIKVTNHGSDFALGDALTYNSLEIDYNYFGRDKHIFYFSMWTKVEEETWFDITISYADTVWSDGVQKKHNQGQYYYDLGRKFKVTPEDGWIEIGKDENGNYLPFRTIGLGTDPGELTTTSYFENTNANEAVGNAYLDLPVGLNWGVIRIYAYGPNSEVATSDGLMGNGVESGITAETSYLVTGVKFWPSGTTFEQVIELEGVTLDATTKELEVGDTFVLTPTYLPNDAEVEVVKYESSNTSVATVNNFGQVTAVGVGTATITFTANNTKTATCTVTVTPKITLNDSDKKTEVGESFTLTPVVDSEGYEIEEMEFSSSDSSVVTVDENGKVTIVGVGTATITVKINNTKTIIYNITTVAPTPKDNGIDPIILAGGAGGILVVAIAAFFIIKKSKK